jgi:hypothetical protein
MVPSSITVTNTSVNNNTVDTLTSSSTLQDEVLLQTAASCGHFADLRTPRRPIHIYKLQPPMKFNVQFRELSPASPINIGIQSFTIQSFAIQLFAIQSFVIQSFTIQSSVIQSFEL